MNTTVFFTDSHTEVEDDLHRFTALGNFIAETRPDSVVSGGDFLSLDSLSAWDMNKRGKMEGRRFKKEIEHGKEAIELLMAPIIQLQTIQRKNKKRVYQPRLVFISGNHEDRYLRYQEINPEIEGIIEIPEAIGLNKHGWEVVPYREYLFMHGVAFTHMPMSGDNKPLRGSRMHINAAMDHVQSVFYGHTHTLNITSIARHGHQDQQIFAINAGIFSEEVPSYAKGSKAVKNYWRGFMVIDHLDDEGGFDLTTYRLDRLLGEYT